jgi:hypothetical protein
MGIIARNNDENDPIFLTRGSGSSVKHRLHCVPEICELFQHFNHLNVTKSFLQALPKLLKIVC